MDLLERVIELRKTSPLPHFAVVDFDGSIIENDSAEATLAYMARQKVHNALRDFHHYYDLRDSGDLHACYRFGATTLQGLESDLVHALVKKVVEHEGPKITQEEFFGRTIARGIAPRKGVIDLIARLQEQGITVWIVTASPELVVRAVMECFSLKAELIGVKNILHDGMVTADLDEPLPMFEGKVACIRKYVHATTKPLLGIGDSMNDYSMLQHSHLRAVVDRGNTLVAEAKKRGWFIL
jgi:HAD superfamily phosphoserine phosphatase-like hydrolase